MDLVRGRVWREGRLVGDMVDLADLDVLLADDSALVWVDLCGPDRSRLAVLAHELGLDPHAVEDAVAHQERAKATRHATHTFVTAYATKLVDADLPGFASRVRLSRVSAFVLRRGLVTVRNDDGFDMAPVIERWLDLADGPDQPPPGPGALLHGLLDVIVDGHFDAIQDLDDRIEALEDLLFDGALRTQEAQRQSYRVRKELVQLRRVVLPMRDVVSSVMRHRADLPAGARVGALDGHYEDLYDHVLRAAEWTESLREMIATVFETTLSLQDARLNTVMKKLAAWAAIIAVPTAVTGWYGQNVPYPGFGQGAGVWQSLLIMGACSIGLFVLFKRQDWI